MEGHRLRVGALAWSSSTLSSGSRDKIILQRDIRAQEDFVSRLTGHKSEVRIIYILNWATRSHPFVLLGSLLHMIWSIPCQGLFLCHLLLFLFPSIISSLSWETYLIRHHFSIINLSNEDFACFCCIFAFVQVCGLKWSYDNRELASGGNDNRVSWNWSFVSHLASVICSREQIGKLVFRFTYCGCWALVWT